MNTNNSLKVLCKKGTKNFHGFTLVELIVVITILTILGTIGFIQLGGFQSSARDSVRTSDISNMIKGLELFQVKTGKYPAPIGTVLSYTGGVSGGNIVSQGTLNGSLIGFSMANPIDPMTKVPYIYSTLRDGLYYQIGAEAENPLARRILGVEPTYADGPKTAMVKGNYTPDPSLPSLIVMSGSVPMTAESGGIFSPDVCFITNGSSDNLVSVGSTGCAMKKVCL
ncbi:hypothetical protein AUJ87_03040 [Candidatus Gracilibacteria bacterium CG1_02_38_174]|nr:MAG: hypothetical protein AUJ87_03040 [Candidatus Gracilibacteria bacterium CG1_02_38_174]